MSGAGIQLAAGLAIPKSRSPLAHLLHALNQPLTGLQCSLELAMAIPRRPDQYVQTLRDGLDLTSRMRNLVEAVRELVDLEQAPPREIQVFPLDVLLRETAAELIPVAEARLVHLQFENAVSLPVQADRRQLTALTFRLFESALALTAQDGSLHISAKTDREQAHILVYWNPGPAPHHSPFSPPELGLLIAQAGWEQAGAEWSQSRTGLTERCSIRLALSYSKES